MSDWFDFSVFDKMVGLVDADLLQIFGIKPVHMQFVLVFTLMLSLMWVVRPIVEWLMIKHWAMIGSYVLASLVALVFLQVVDRYAMVQNQSALPPDFWPVCLLAISGYGVAYTLVALGGRAWKRLSKRSKKRAA
ncbi:hypothetical protein H0266_05515 [Halobacillus locisalis]|uniref:Uncharacterized protein n=1 Tax=Halobacillus locisalis TaxID=220753 RepID=A0A838CQY7_9BACI|nr:hypothetical protein [Halobacillus locisalis]MBA2174361.1 hypothetical protein [Halobacillus locisalis]